MRLNTLFSEMFFRYAFVAGITHSAHTGLFTVLTFVVLGFFLMSRVDFSTVCVMFISSGVLLIIVWLTLYEGSLGSYVATA